MLGTALIAVTMFCLALVRGASGVFNMVSPRHDPNLFTVVRVRGALFENRT